VSAGIRPSTLPSRPRDDQVPTVQARNSVDLAFYTIGPEPRRGESLGAKRDCALTVKQRARPTSRGSILASGSL
jgi:hypothetical protein